MSASETVATERAMTSTTSYGGRVYTHPITGETFRSVTTILNAAAKPALDRWKTKTIAEFAADNRESLAMMERDAAYDLVRSSQYTASGASAATGEAVHSRLELLCNLLAEYRESNSHLSDSVSTADLLAWMDRHPPSPELEHVDRMFRELLDEFELQVLHTEATLINRAVGYAGSADLIARIRRRGFPDAMKRDEARAPWKTAVIDAKSGKSIYGSVALQLVGYGKAEHILLPSGDELPMPVVHETYALHIRPRSWALRPMEYSRRAWEAFKSLVTVDEWVNLHERDAVGDAINAGAIARRRSGTDDVSRNAA